MTARCAGGIGTAVLMAVATPIVSARQEAAYDISRYELTVDLSPGGTSARVTMDITYRIESGVKSDGFKYVGQLQPTALEGFEGDGTPMQVTTERQRETMVRWRFRPARRGTTRVVVRFTIPSLITGTPAENTFSAPWAGVFRVPVAQAVFRLVPPAGWTEESIASQPAGEVRSTADGRRAIEIAQAPLSRQAFIVTFRPGVVEGPPIEGLPAATQPSTITNEIAGPILVGLILLALFIAARAKRSKRQGAGDSGFVSSCAGGSSCSSSCGGGGCGGGCGG